MKIETVIFDLDGTLLNTLEDLTDAVNHALIKFKMPTRDISEIRAFVGNGVRRLMIKAVPGGESNPEFEAVFEEFSQYYNIHCNDKTRPYDGVAELIDALAEKNIKLAIVSNKVDAAVQVLREKYFSRIDVAVGDREGMRRKPYADGVFAAMKECGAKKESTIYVGDSEVDLETAENAGLRSVSVLWGFRDKELLLANGAETFIEKPMELLGVLEI